MNFKPKINKMAVFKPDPGEVTYPDPMYYTPSEKTNQPDQSTNQVKAGLGQNDYLEVLGVVIGAGVIIVILLMK
jgi:hypothetical protein